MQKYNFTGILDVSAYVLRGNPTMALCSVCRDATYHMHQRLAILNLSCLPCLLWTFQMGMRLSCSSSTSQLCLCTCIHWDLEAFHISYLVMLLAWPEITLRSSGLGLASLLWAGGTSTKSSPVIVISLCTKISLSMLIYRVHNSWMCSCVSNLETFDSIDWASL